MREDDHDVEPLIQAELEKYDIEIEDTPYERFLRWLNGQQWVVLVAFLTGAVLLFAVNRRVGLATIHCALREVPDRLIHAPWETALPSRLPRPSGGHAERRVLALEPFASAGESPGRT